MITKFVCITVIVFTCFIYIKCENNKSISIPSININETNNHNSTFCLNLKMYIFISEGNNTFCGLTKRWKPRISNVVAVIACIVPSFFAWIFTFIVIIYSIRPLKELYRVSVDSKYQKERQELHSKNRRTSTDLVNISSKTDNDR